MLKINREDSLPVRGEARNNARQNVDEISEAVMQRMTFTAHNAPPFYITAPFPVT